MNHAEALKEVQVMKPPREGFMVLKFEYNFKLLLPHKEGVALLACLASAEQLVNNYSDPGRIIPMEHDRIEITLLSRKDYERYKMAGLLNLTYNEIKAGETPPKIESET